VKELADAAAGKVEGGPARMVLFFVGLAATVIVTVYVTRLARQALKQAIPEPETPPPILVPDVGSETGVKEEGAAHA
jgi:hypothetical protein